MIKSRVWKLDKLKRKLEWLLQMERLLQSCGKSNSFITCFSVIHYLTSYCIIIFTNLSDTKNRFSGKYHEFFIHLKVRKRIIKIMGFRAVTDSKNLQCYQYLP